MKRWAKISRAAVFLVLITTPLFLFGHDGFWIGSAKPEFRPPASFPAMNFRPSTFRQFNQWFADRIGMRLLAIQIGSGLHVGLLNRSTAPSVYLASDGWIFWDDSGKNELATLIDMRGRLRFSAAEIGGLNRSLETMQKQFAACGMVGLLLIAPDKQSIYGEPLGISGQRRTTRLDDLLARVSLPARQMIVDVREDLLRAKSRALYPLYYRTDTHWNEIGALAASHVVAERLLAGHVPIDPKALDLNQFDVATSKFRGDLSDRMLFSGDRFPDETFTLTRKAPVDPVATKVLFIGDSFSPSMHKFLQPMMPNMVFVTHSEIDLSRIQREAPNVVLIETVERNLWRWVKFDGAIPSFCERKDSAS